MYYVNGVTGETQYDAPTAAAAERLSMPNGWETTVSRTTGKVRRARAAGAAARHAVLTRPRVLRGVSFLATSLFALLSIPWARQVYYVNMWTAESRFDPHLAVQTLNPCSGSR
jgi:hypothetical protein